MGDDDVHYIRRLFYHLTTYVIMYSAPIPHDDDTRLCAVYGLNILDTPPDKRFDDITKKAIELFHVPISTITIVDKDREWYKSKQGIPQSEGPRATSFCGHALLQEEIMIIEDTLLDPRFADNPYVTGTPSIRFYAGKSLYDKNSTAAVGVFCIKDYQPRTMSVQEIDQFLDLAAKAEQELQKNNTLA